MQYSIILAAILLLPLVLGLVTRVSASHLFFSVMAGELLARYFGHEAELILQSLFKNSTLASYGEVIVLLLPMLLTALFMKGTLSKGRTVLHIIPFLITGLVLGVFMLPVLPPDIQDGLKSLQYGSQILELNTALIGLIVLVQLIALWLFDRGEHKKRGRKHK